MATFVPSNVRDAMVKYGVNNIYLRLKDCYKYIWRFFLFFQGQYIEEFDSNFKT